LDATNNYNDTAKLKWKEAFGVEVANIEDREVLGEYLTQEAVRAAGTTQRPIPMRMLFDVKLKPDGSFDKLKCRLIVCGHTGYLRKGESFWATYSASPNLSTSRLIQAIVCQEGYHRLTYDIACAYLWAKTRPEERLPILMPPGMVRVDPKTGKPMVRMLEKTCYGAPFSDRRYCQLRDDFIAKHFGGNGWEVVQSNYDPCLFTLRSGDAHILLSIFTDDVDSAGNHEEALKWVAQQFDDRFKIKYCNVDFMLGLMRVLSKDGTTMTITQPGFVDSVVEQFKDGLKGKRGGTPFPPGKHFSRAGVAIDPAITKQVYALGYQSGVGSLLWAMRNCYPELAIGVSFMCSLMSEPTEEAMDSVYHAVKYLKDNRDFGIRFTRQVAPKAPTLIAYYDASARPDLIDTRMRGGFVVFFCNGPVEWGAGKLPHVGMSTLHVEFQALCWVTKTVVHLRNVLTDMGFGHYVTEPTTLLGDNAAATSLGREKMLTPGNKWFTRDLHYSREQCELQQTDPRWIGTEGNLADDFTKAVDGGIHKKHIYLIKGYDPVGLPLPPPRAPD
jgi:hypothetical protein